MAGGGELRTADLRIETEKPGEAEWDRIDSGQVWSLECMERHTGKALSYSLVGTREKRFGGKSYLYKYYRDEEGGYWYTSHRRPE